MKYLRYYYFRYFYSFDPTSSWLRHCVKIIVCSLITMVIALKEAHMAALWLILPTVLLMLMVNVEQPFNIRLLHLVRMWLLGFVAVLLMMLVAKWEWASVSMFLLLALLGTYAINFGPDYAKAGILTMVFAVIALRLRFGIPYIGVVSLNFFIDLVLMLVVSVVLWPNRLSTQLDRGLRVGFRALGRYLCFVLNDATVGNHDHEYRAEYQKQVFLLLNSIHNFNAAYQKRQATPMLQEITDKFCHLLYLCVSMEAAIASLSSRAYFNGPLTEVHQYAACYRQFFIASKKGDYSQMKYFADRQQQLQQALYKQQATIQSAIPQLIPDYQHWNQVLYQLQAINLSIAEFVALLQRYE